jgi:2-polyprenyl-3-methyl-5-hydroxy-6-metoxy-1,4-benzoquinol methylase
MDRPQQPVTTDSKVHWLSGVRDKLESFDIRLGAATAQAYVNDPRMIAFIAARYKFAAKMLAGVRLAIEVGCGDAFGAPIVAQSVRRLICTDIDRETIAENEKRCRMFRNLSFEYFDFRSQWHGPADAIYLIDVIEHIFPHEQDVFMHNLEQSLEEDGIMLIGTPNKTAEPYASKHSRAGHVNLKTHEDLYRLLERRFARVFMFGMSDEVVHTGFAPMAQYLWAMGVGRR